MLRRACIVIAGAARPGTASIPSFVDVAAPRRVQRRLDGDDHRLRDRRTTTTWPVFAPIWMLFLSCIVCSTGSTGGGIKMFRTLLLARQAGRELKLLVHPSAMAPVRDRRPGDSRPGRRCRAGLHLSVLHDVALLTFAMLLYRPRLRLVVQRDRGGDQQHRARPGTVGPVGNYHSLTDCRPGSARSRCSSAGWRSSA